MNELDAINEMLTGLGQRPVSPTSATVPTVTAFAKTLLDDATASAARTTLGLAGTETMRKLYLSNFGVVANVSVPGQAAAANTAAFKAAVAAAALLANTNGRFVRIVPDVPYFYIDEAIEIPAYIYIDSEGMNCEIRWWGGATPMLNFTAADATWNGVSGVILDCEPSGAATAATCGVYFDGVVNASHTRLDDLQITDSDGPAISVLSYVGMTVSRFVGGSGCTSIIQARASCHNGMLNLLDSNFDAPSTDVIDVVYGGAINLTNVRIEGGSGYNVVHQAASGPYPVTFNSVHFSNDGTVDNLVLADSGSSGIQTPVYGHGVSHNNATTVTNIYAATDVAAATVAWPTEDAFQGYDQTQGNAGISFTINAPALVASTSWMRLAADTLGRIAPVLTKTTTGDASLTIEGVVQINTFDNTVKMYADGAWRTLASGW